MFKKIKILLIVLMLLALAGSSIAAQYARPDGTTDPGTPNPWGVVGAATLHEATRETTPGGNGDTDYMSSDKFNTTAELSLSNVNAPTVDTGHIIRFAFRAIGGGDETCQVALYQGAAPIASTPAESNTSGTYATFSYTLTTGEAANISDYTDLRFQVTSANSRKGEDIRVTWLEFEVPDSFTIPTVANPNVSGITADSATLEAEVTDNGGQALSARGTVWNTTGTPDIITDSARALAEGGTGVTVFSHLRTGFPEKTVIYFRGYATNGQGTGYTADLAFRTEPLTQASNITFPVVGAADMTISWSRGSGDSVIVLLKAASAAAAPTDWTQYTASSIFGSGDDLGDGTRVVYTGTGTSVPVTNLTPGTTYHAAVYEVAGTAGPGLTGINYLHATAAPTNSQLIVGPPAVSTPTVTNVSTNSATLGATVDGDGGDPGGLTDRGTVWNTTGSPIVENSQSKTGQPVVGEFTQTVSGLPSDSLVYFRGYASNSYGTSYSEDATFYTEPSIQASAINFTNVTDASMTINWTAGSGDGSIVVVRAGGAVNSDPVDENEYTASGTFGSGEDLGGGNYVVYRGSQTSVNVTNLIPAVTYHVAVYEYKGVGTGQGGINYKLGAATASQLIIGAPQVSTPTVADVTTTTATLGATVDNDGGAGSVDARGTVWNTTGDPDIVTDAARALAEGGTAVTDFSHTRTGLTAGSVIYFRGYATNSFGTAYSPQEYFFTEPPTQASAIGFADVAYSMMSINWTRGDGDGVVVVVREGTEPNAIPTDGVEYLARTDFGNVSAEIGTGNFVVYEGNGTSVRVVNLTPQVTYHVAIYEYTGYGT
ncbi:MAG: fibronectin type III domain-containing protein, partial [Anaerohalosphaeraceae bacterium]